MTTDTRVRTATTAMTEGRGPTRPDAATAS